MKRRILLHFARPTAPMMLVVAVAIGVGLGFTAIAKDDVSPYIERAKNGNSASALWLGRYFGNQKTPVYNPEKSAYWLAKAAKLGNKIAITELGYEKPYLAVSNLQCFGGTLSIETVCSSIDKTLALPACYSQHIVFKKDNHEHDYFLLNEDYRDDLTIAYEVECLKSPIQSWVVLRSTNFGSGNTCLDCEREDYFSADGTYSGSMDSALGKKILRGYKKATPELQRTIEQTIKQNAAHRQIFEIKRYPLIN